MTDIKPAPTVRYTPQACDLVLTCMDYRIDPERILDRWEPGRAGRATYCLRNAGGLLGASEKENIDVLLGAGKTLRRIVHIGHSDCARVRATHGDAAPEHLDAASRSTAWDQASSLNGLSSIKQHRQDKSPVEVVSLWLDLARGSDLYTSGLDRCRFVPVQPASQPDRRPSASQAGAALGLILAAGLGCWMYSGRSFGGRAAPI
jgi:carbonic anhydrase